MIFSTFYEGGALPMPPDQADGTDGLGWTVRRTQKTHRVEILQPLTIAHVGLTARHILYVASVHQTHSETVIPQLNPQDVMSCAIFSDVLGNVVGLGKCLGGHAITEIRRFRLPTLLRRIED
jgi:hypothetical protein